MDKKAVERLPVMDLEITDVKIYPFDTSGIGGNVKAVAEIVINGVLKIKDIKIVESNRGFFIQMPTRKSKSGEFVPVVEAMDKNLYLHIRRKILDKFKEEISRYDSYLQEF
ncbi:SpoVG family protein [Desulfurobacterium indicum]|uniref:SpoVG family protein n=1 Tax=Desulfurobacterium indicum TaxID=1914305 RepID=UPI00098EB941|nr:SpoVG family protein [Desulfurobacterium indicum]